MMVYFILNKLVKEENFKIRHTNLHGMRFGIGDHKAFTSIGKMYTLANVWTESRLGWEESMKSIWRPCHNIFCIVLMICVTENVLQAEMEKILIECLLEISQKIYADFDPCN